MNANEYKSLKNSGRILDFATLKETHKCLLEADHVQLAQSVAQTLADNGIDKPLYHSKIEEQFTDYYRVDLSTADIEIIVSMFCDKEISALTTNFETTPLASHYASLLDRWNELIV